MAHRPLNKTHVEDVIGLTPMQEGMLYHYLRDKDTEAYFEQYSYTLRGQLDLSVCCEAWKWTIQQNEVLRSVFRWEKIQNPVQIILKGRVLSFAFHDLTEMAEMEQEVVLQELREADRAVGFDLSEGPLLRITVFRLTHDRHIMMVSNHHIVMDGWSNGIVLGEFIHAYRTLRAGREPERISKPHFREYVKWLGKQNKSGSKAFWQAYLAGYEAQPLYLLNTTSAPQISDTACESYILPPDLVSELEAVAKEESVTIGTLFTTAWGVLLQKVSGRQDVLFGTTVSGRSSSLPGIERMVGLLMNTVPMRLQSGNSDTLQQALLDVQQASIARQPYETTPLVDIQTYGNFRSTEPLFDTLLVIENYPLEINEQSELTLESFAGHSVTDYSLLVSIHQLEQTAIQMMYQPSTYEPSAIELLCERYVALLRLMVTERDCTIQDIHSLTEMEKGLQEVWAIEFDYSPDTLKRGV
ncbi:condensation domain-containing protein [Paenibacillus jamilae]|uniref:condensation domain-containing protein n=1 Tax=Paenibacillus jamilae TaxID=114136 RepID=UPI003D29A7BD